MSIHGSAGLNYLQSSGTLVPPSPNASVSYWVYINSFSGTRPWGVNTDFENRILGTGQVVNDMYNVTDGTTSVSTLSTGQWYHIVTTADHVTTADEVYINGQLDASGFLAVGGAATSGVLTICSSTWNIGQGMDATIDDWRLYDRILTAAEVSTIYACEGSDGIMDGLLHRFIFVEASNGTTPGAGAVKDLASGSIGSLSPTGSPTIEGSVLHFTRRVKQAR